MKSQNKLNALCLMRLYIYICWKIRPRRISMVLNNFSQFYTIKFNQSFCHIDVGISDFSCYFIILRKFHGFTIHRRIQHLLQDEQCGFRPYHNNYNSLLHLDPPCIYLINNVSQKVTVSPWPHGVWVTFAHNYYLVYRVHVCVCVGYIMLYILFYLLWSLVKRRGVRLKKWK